MRFVIWGAGVRGIRLAPIINSKVDAFIDTDEKKMGTRILGKPIISLDEYLQLYPHDYIIISPKRKDDIIETIKKSGVRRFFDLDSASPEFSYSNSASRWKDALSGIKDSPVAIYGNNLTSFLWYELLLDKGYDAYLIPNTTKKHELVDCIKYDFPKWKFLPIENAWKMKCICLTVPIIPLKYDEIPIELKTNGISHTDYQQLKEISSVINLYDFTESFPDFYCNLKLKRFFDIHRGERCFIIGNGPSLRMEDLDIIAEKKIVSFGVNAIFFGFDKTKWRPTYYVVGDPTAQRLYSKEISEMKSRAIFVAQTVDERDSFENLSIENLYRTHVQAVFSFSNDIAKCIYDKGSVTYECIQIAVYMGFKEIFLLGCDCDYSLSSDKEYVYFSEKVTNNDRYQIDSKDMEKNFQYDNVFYQYRLARDYADKNDIKICNATRGGKLEVFERVDFDEIMMPQYS